MEASPYFPRKNAIWAGREAKNRRAQMEVEQGLPEGALALPIQSGGRTRHWPHESLFVMCSVGTPRGCTPGSLGEGSGNPLGGHAFCLSTNPVANLLELLPPDPADLEATKVLVSRYQETEDRDV